MFRIHLIILCLVAPLILKAQSPVRSIDGGGNNQSNPDWGMAGIMINRYTSNGYEDSVSMPGGMDRPNPRAISNALFDQENSIPNEYGLSDYVWNFGQFIDHDITLVPDNPAEFMPIPVPAGDPVFDPAATGSVMIPMFRSMSNPTTGSNSSNPRMQINAITSWLDASAVYGSDSIRANWLRTFSDGKLKISTGNLLPYNTISGEYGDLIDPDAPFMANEGQDSFLFVAGDIRCNEQPGLTALHTLFVREHNRICDLLRAQHPFVSDEYLYQRAKKIVAAEIQKITFDDWLPSMGIVLDPYNGYDNTTNPNIMNVFSSAAYRFGHTMVGKRILRLTEDWDTISSGNIGLKDAFFNPSIIKNNGISTYLRGMLIHRQQNVDIKIVDDLRNFLFGPPGAGGLDLASINIMRGRERGLVDYNQIRSDMGMPIISSFSEITQDVVLQNKLQTLYGSIEKIDAWVGMLAEDHRSEVAFGDCIYIIVKHQFQKLRDGDRFYYENDPSMNSVELDFVKNTTLAGIIENNTGVDVPVDNVFKVWSTVGIASVDQRENVKIFPNPSSDYISFHLPEKANDLHFQMFDLNGKKVYSGQSKFPHETRIPVSGLSSGIYSITIATPDGEPYHARFIKK